MHSKGNNKHNKNNLVLRENIFKESNWRGVNLQNIQTPHAAQLKKIKKKNKQKI